MCMDMLGQVLAQIASLKEPTAFFSRCMCQLQPPYASPLCRTNAGGWCSGGRAVEPAGAGGQGGGRGEGTAGTESCCWGACWVVVSVPGCRSRWTRWGLK